MKWTSANELREKFLTFFESKNHLKLHSFSLIPQSDKSLLLINSGMAPMKKYFTGEVKPPNTRITTCQKCIRTPDIDRVGQTARHGTFFEMLGNFSFGDYFKKEAIKWSWEFCRDVLELPLNKIYVSIYQDDNEAFDIWSNEVGVSKDHIVRLGKEDNFWEHGPGPCGPCSELYFDRGEEYGCKSETCGVGCDCDRYIEFWNLVFTQFESDGKGNYKNLEHPNIDTGMGLERLACIMQNVDNLFLIDSVQMIIEKLSSLSSKKYGKNNLTDISLRVIADHIRSVVFMAGDGVLPSNEGRGYVMRRLLRRAARHGKLLGLNKPFLYELSNTVIEQNKIAYPNLLKKESFIKQLIFSEETAFAKTINQGLEILNSMISDTKSNIFSGENAFKLSDTYGFPLDLTKEIVAEKGLAIDEKRFNELMKNQRELARKSREELNSKAWSQKEDELFNLKPTVFMGYMRMNTEAKILAITKNDDKTCNIILSTTPFYAESGGQVGDTGEIFCENFRACVLDTQKNKSGIFLHKCLIKEGSPSVGDIVTCNVDSIRRSIISRNHTAAHLLHAALRSVLGDSVKQAGQLVNEKQIRFDFTHFSALTKEELEKVEKTVNEKIFDSLRIFVKEMPIEEAKQTGAIALFEDKYGETVRVVNIGDYSVELCGGTHVKNTSMLGIFKITSESSVASGVRRIEAVSCSNTSQLFDFYKDLVLSCSEELKVNSPNDILARIKEINNELKEKNQIIDRFVEKSVNMQVSKLLNSSESIGNLNLILACLKGANSQILKTACEKISSKDPSSVTILVGLEDQKGTLAVSIGSNIISENLHAGKLAKKIAELADGNGGGRPEFAMAGLKDISKIDFMLSQCKKIIEESR